MENETILNSNNGEDVEQDKKWVTKDDRKKLERAKELAELVLTQESITKGEITSAIKRIT